MNASKVKIQCIKVAAETSRITCLMKKKNYTCGFRSGTIQWQQAAAANNRNIMMDYCSKQDSNKFFKKKNYLTWNRSAPR